MIFWQNARINLLRFLFTFEIFEKFQKQIFNLTSKIWGREGVNPILNSSKKSLQILYVFVPKMKM